MRISEKKHLRVSAHRPKHPLTGGAEMHQRGARRATAETQGNETQTKMEIMQAGRAKQVTAHLSLFCLTLFEIDSI